MNKSSNNFIEYILFAVFFLGLCYLLRELNNILFSGPYRLIQSFELTPFKNVVLVLYELPLVYFLINIKKLPAWLEKTGQVLYYLSIAIYTLLLLLLVFNII